MSVLYRNDLYTLVKQLLLGFSMDDTLFGILLGMAKGNIEQQRPWSYLRSEDSSQGAAPATNSYANSLYLTPISLPTDFIKSFSPKRAIVLVASDGITMQWYDEIPLERKHEYKDDNTKFYVDYKNKKYFLCGTLDRPYSIHQFYIGYSPDITNSVSWTFPSEFQPILAFHVAKMYREMFDYDVVNVAQGEMIESTIKLIEKQMNNWDSAMQESMIDGVDYPNSFGRPGFRANVVGDNE